MKREKVVLTAVARHFASSQVRPVPWHDITEIDGLKVTDQSILKALHGGGLIYLIHVGASVEPIFVCGLTERGSAALDQKQSVADRLRRGP